MVCLIRLTRRWRRTGSLVVGFVLTAFGVSSAQSPLLEDPVGHPTFVSPHTSPIVARGGRVFVANTPADTVDVIDVASLTVMARVNVGIDPVSVAIRPDGRELWVSNHISDSVSVIDTDPESPTHLQVIATVQDFEPVTRATRFDEPMGVAFASDEKAYVVLSSENQVAVIDVVSRQVVRTLTITAQDPRALAVRGDRLYVIPFESNNQTQLSGCRGPIDGQLCTFDAQEHVITNNNVLSLNYDADIVRNSAIPDRDLYVFDTTTDELVDVVNTLGTLLYGLAVDSNGRVFVAQTEARNDANGRAGTLKQGLAELENRAFLNQITSVNCSGATCGSPEFIDLEPLPPIHPEPGMALATPFAIQVSEDDSTLVLSAAGSNKLFTVDAVSGAVLGRVEVGAVPRGIALESDEDGQPARGWVFNAVANTVSVVDLSDATKPSVVATILLVDPTPPSVKRGRIAFNDADVSTTGTFSCDSCHPDGHTDQLLWVLDTPVCDVPGCTQIPPRLTMPVRGLRDTAPYHWDGIPGDPFGGNNTANIRGNSAPNCDPNVPESCTRFLVDGSLATTMCLVGRCPVNDEGRPGALTGAERNDLAAFLLSVPYPPAQRRSYDNVLSSRARNGFKAFHIDGDDQGDPQPNVCGNCHRMPFWVSTNTPGTGMDAPTWRGAYDRWVILPQGRLNLISFSFYEAITRSGTPERELWRFSWGGRQAFDPVWDMVLEGSTGFSGSLARQVTLNRTTTDDVLTDSLLDALELSATEGGIVLQGDGVFIDGPTATPTTLRFSDGLYLERDAEPESFSRTALISLAAQGRFVGTFTARQGVNVGMDNPQPALWGFLASIHGQRGAQAFPTLSDDQTSMMISGRHLREGAHVIVDGRRVPGTVRCVSGTLPSCGFEMVTVELAVLPPAPGIHFLQVQNPDGLFSNDYIFFTKAPVDGSPLNIRQTVGAATALSAVTTLPRLDRVRGVGGGLVDTEVFTAADGTRFKTETVVGGLEVPTGLAFAPDGRLFVSERPGRVRVVRQGQLLAEPALVLRDVFTAGEAGLLGLALDPEFDQNAFIYLLYTRDRPGASPVHRIVRYREVRNTLSEPTVLLDELPAAAARGGGRLRFGPDGLLYAALGDGGDTDAAQDLASPAGKMLRIRRDGTTPETNPFASPVYSIGHRNPQGFDWHPLTGALWSTEHGPVGPVGRDEVNHIEAGVNYGWPLDEGVEMMPGVRPPALTFSPPVAVSGASFYSGTAIEGFRHDLFVATLDGTHLHRVQFDPADSSQIVGTERLLDGRFGRLRDVVTGPDGSLYVATSNRDGRGSTTEDDDRLIRLSPVR